ncbi:MAG TPA: glycosyltransferase family 1 protein [Thermoanaerobaculia bacterium]|nr:glycosyltransferase family 1 protein [Thermoanaerobaculia bacterium]
MRVGIDARKIADYGIGTYIRGLLRGVAELRRADLEVIAFAPRGANVPEGIRHEIADAPHYSFRELFLLGRAAKRATVDVFHAPHYVTPLTSLPLVVTIHDLIHLHQPQRNPLAPFYARTMIRRAMRNAARVLTVSHAVEDDLLAFGCDPRKIRVTYNGVEPQPAGHHPPDAHRFLAIANDKPHKNIETLVAAFALVRNELPSATLTLVGSAFTRFAQRDGIDARGFVDDEELHSLYRTSTALIVPSLEEGFGLPAAEAMAHGCAVITSNARALVEITGDAALHVEARDARAFAAAMLRIARDASLREQLATRGVVRARDFSWTRCAERTVEAWFDAWNIVERRV